MRLELLVRCVQRTPLSTVSKHALCSLMQMWGRVVLLLSLSGMTFAMLVGEYSSISSIDSSREHWYSEGRLADLEAMFIPSPDALSANLDTVPGVEELAVRSRQYGDLALKDDKEIGALLVSQDIAPTKAAVNRLHILEGRSLDERAADEILIDAGSAEANEIILGDHLTLKITGDVYKVSVVGIVRDPEFLVSMANPSLFAPSKGSMAIVHANSKMLENFSPNSVAIRLEGEADRDEVERLLGENLRNAGASDVSFIDRQEQLGYVYLEKNLSVFKVLIPAMVIVACLAAGFVTVYLLAQWVAQQRKQIALFLVEGFSRSHILRGFAFSVLVLTVATIVLGTFWAWFVGQVFLSTFASGLGMPVPTFTFDPAILLITTIIITFMYFTCSILAFRPILKENPKALFTVETGDSPVPKSSDKHLPLSTPLLVSKRSLRSHKVVSISTVAALMLGFGLTSGIVLTYFSVMDTAESAVTKNEWDATVDFAAPTSITDAKNILQIAGTSEMSTYIKGVAQINQDSTQVNLSVGGFDPSRLWQIVPIIDGSDISTNSPQNSVVLESTAAKKLSITVGDVFDIEIDGETFESELIGIMSSPLPGEARVALSYGQQLFSLQDSCNGALIRTNNIEDIRHNLESNDHVQQVLDKEQIIKLVVGSSEQVTGVLWLGALMGGAIGILFLFSCLGYVILKRSQEYKTLSILGFKSLNIRWAIIIETCVLGVTALVLAVPAALLYGKYLTTQVTASWFLVELTTSPAPFSITLIPAFCLLPISAIGISKMAIKDS